MTLTYGSVCSGIEAASVAWGPIGFNPLWFSEIEPFPSAVLSHHWPDIPNLGDMTQIRISKDNAPDILVGGTPCQAFSMSGNRESLSDERGQLTISYINLLDKIDESRETPAIAVWENVPGVLSTKDNAFGCFLAGLAGEDQPLQSSGRKWSNAGCVFGPKRTVAWRLLDAQYFGLAQRRKRVFVVASARKDICPTKILFEFEGLRRDSEPSREKGQGASEGVNKGANKSMQSWWDGGQLSQTLDAVLYKGQTMPEKNRFPAVLTCDGSVDIAPTLMARSSRGGGQTLSPGHQSDGHMVLQNRVRKITPVEAERLQGFPDNHTLITFGPRKRFCKETKLYIEQHLGKGLTDDEFRLLASDGNRYKAIGNSMPVPVMKWIGERINDHILNSSPRRSNGYW